MTRLITVFSLIFIAFAVRAGGPYLRLDSAYIDMGVVRGDTIVVGTMGFRNTGSEPLTIIRIFTECGCTVPEFSGTPVEPGESGVIRVRFDGRNRTNGHFRKVLRVKSNADNPRESFVIKGMIMKDSDT